MNGQIWQEEGQGAAVYAVARAPAAGRPCNAPPSTAHRSCHSLEVESKSVKPLAMLAGGLLQHAFGSIAAIVARAR
mgnify:CR=1 FL=1